MTSKEQQTVANIMILFVVDISAQLESLIVINSLSLESNLLKILFEAPLVGGLCQQRIIKFFAFFSITSMYTLTWNASPKIAMGDKEF